MITAQDIREKCFEKARIGGYAMDVHAVGNDITTRQ